MTAPYGTIFALGKDVPQIHPTSYVAPGAQVIGRVILGEQASVWFNAVLRGDLAKIEVGAGSNIKDNTTVHIDGSEERDDGVERGTKIGRNVTIGHNCIVHSCTIEDECLIGMGSVVMGGALVGRGSVVGAGAVVLEGTVIPPYSLAVGNPAKVKKTYPPEFTQRYNLRAAEIYKRRVEIFRQGLAAVIGPR